MTDNIISNIFCCNCDGPCKGGKSTDLSDEKTANLCLSKFTAVDVNQDGMISFLEWVQSRDAFAGLGLDVPAERWNQYDWERKGYLTKDEAMDRRIASSKPGSDTKDTTLVQQPFDYQPRLQENLKPNELSRGAWTLQWFTDNDCSEGKHRTAGTKPEGCSNIAGAKGIEFTASPEFSLYVYGRQNCDGVPRMISSNPDCYPLNVKGLSFKVVYMNLTAYF
ncbi:hypothetical protein FCIRC_6540 [Fusarium circinatum]|uniref:EF-hand domain-containing protein n=1 Tax=Fusarium circinatum TaxID=48490 RepID=A0A8H5TYR9_FUSCI|nr:hypothetical protein FCIRC_6540 [Fusarium circinatum]